MIQTSFKRNPSLNFAMIQKEKCRPKRKVVAHLPAVSESANFFLPNRIVTISWCLFMPANLCQISKLFCKSYECSGNKEDPHTV